MTKKNKNMTFSPKNTKEENDANFEALKEKMYGPYDGTQKKGLPSERTRSYKRRNHILKVKTDE